MTKLEAEILSVGCSDLAALQWCKERKASVLFYADCVVVDVGEARGEGYALCAAVLECVRAKHKGRG